MTLPLDQCEHLYRFIWKDLTKYKCTLLRIGGIQNHIHMLIELHPSISLSVLMQNIKSHSSGWLKSDHRFPDFNGWAAEYFASTLSVNQKTATINYIKTQHEHHLNIRFDDELKTLYVEAGQSYNDLDMK